MESSPLWLSTNLLCLYLITTANVLLLLNCPPQCKCLCLAEFWTPIATLFLCEQTSEKIRTICHHWACKKQTKSFSPSEVQYKELHRVPPTLYNPPTQVSTYMSNTCFYCKLEVTPNNKTFLFYSRGTLVPKVISANLLQLLLILSAHRFLYRDHCYSKLLLPFPSLLLRRRESCHCNYYLKFFRNLYQPFP